MSGESINTYLAELKKLSLYCNYGENLTEQIRDKFISGLSNEKVKQKLLNESEVTLEKAYNITVQLENTDRDLEVMTSKYKQELQKKYAGGSRVRELEIGKSVLARDYRSNSNKWMEGIILDNQINSNLDDDAFDTELVFKDKEYPSVCNETSSSVIIKSPNTVCSNSVVRKSEILPSVEKNVSNGSQLKEIVSSPQKTESSPLILKRSVRIRKKPDRLNL
ncbi:unnamed protein product, partial [Brenthis ino]